MSEQNKPKGIPGTQGSDGQQKAGGLISGIVAVLAALLVVALVFTGVFYFSLKSNLFSLGDKFRPAFRDNPVLRLALPSEPAGYDPEAAENLSAAQLIERYDHYRQLATTLSAELDAANTSLAAFEARNLSQSAIEAAAADQTAANETELASIARQKAELEELRKQVVTAAAGVDTTGFRTWYETLDPEAAAAIYESIQAAAAADGQAKLAARPFELMDRKKAAGVLTELWGKDKALLVSIVDANKSQTLAEILAEMEATLAADITRSLADYRRSKAEAVKTTAASP